MAMARMNANAGAPAAGRGEDQKVRYILEKLVSSSALKIKGNPELTSKTVTLFAEDSG
jgi:hypothetical protein